MTRPRAREDALPDCCRELARRAHAVAELLEQAAALTPPEPPDAVAALLALARDVHAAADDLRQTVEGPHNAF